MPCLPKRGAKRCPAAPPLSYLPCRAGHHHLGRVLAESDLLHAQAWVIAVGIKAAHLQARRGELGTFIQLQGSPPLWCTPTSAHQLAGYRLRRTGCSGHHAREKSVPTHPPALPPRRGRPTRWDTRNKRLLCPHGASHGSCAELGDTSPGHNWDGSDGCILHARLWV